MPLSARATLVVRLAPEIDPAQGHAQARELLAWALSGARDRGEAGEIGSGGAVWRKGGPLRRHAAWRHGAARVFGRPAPRIAEFDRLGELSASGVPAVRPVLAVAAYRGARCLGQALATALEHDVSPLEARLAAAESGERRGLARAFAELAARLHAAGFEHRDLYLRNVLVRGSNGTSDELVLIDLWRGGRRTSAGAGLDPARSARDLGQALLDGAALWSAPEQALVLEHYLDVRRAANGAVFADVERARWFEAIKRSRAHEARRVAADPRRRRERPVPALDWSPPITTR